jgi:hypothetical protein
MINTYKDLIGKHDMKRSLEATNGRSGDTRNVQLKKQKQIPRIDTSRRKIQRWFVLNKLKELQVA